MFLESLTTRQSGRLAQPDGGAGKPFQSVVATFRVGRVVGTTTVDHSMKVGASHTPSLTPLPHRRRSVGEEDILQAAALAPVVETGEYEDA